MPLTDTDFSTSDILNVSGSMSSSIIDAETGVTAKVIEGTRRLKVDAQITTGSITITSGSFTATPSPFTVQFGTFLENTGSADLLVDGSGTPVSFRIDAPSNGQTNITIRELRFIMTAQQLKFNGSAFASQPELTNGIEFNIKVNNGTTASFATLKKNEDFLRVAGPPGQNLWLEYGGPNDVMTAVHVFDAKMQLVTGSTDFVEVKIRDDLSQPTSCKIKYFTATLYGLRE